jgi:esterase/lipase superfamily enzyme
MWVYGHAGRPLVAFPTAGGYAHEWQHHGAVGALQDLIDRGLVRLYCPETNVAEVWTRGGPDLRWRMARHVAYERFVTEELVPRMWSETGRRDVLAMGCSVGALYAVNFGLKYPELFPRVVGLSGRYDGRFFTGEVTDEVYYNDPLCYAWNLNGGHLERIRRHTHVTLVCGRGAFEGTCLRETVQLAEALRGKDVPLWTDLWGQDVAHEWQWWRRQIRYQVVRHL